MYICTYLKLLTSLVQIYLIIEHTLYQIYVDSSLLGYRSEVSPIKLSKDKKRNYFNFAIQNDNSMHRGVCISPEKHVLFNDISKEDNNTGIEIKRFKSSENNGDIIAKDFKKTEVNFERKYFQRKPFTLQQVINECVIHDSGYIWISLQLATRNNKSKRRCTITN